MFENAEVPVDDLPGTDDLDWKPLHPAYVRRLQVHALLFWFVLLAGAAVFTVFLHWLVVPTVLVWVAVIGLGIVNVVWPTVSVPRCGYVAREHDIVYRSGVLWRSVTAVPYNRIQHVETANTPLDRRFGLASLQLFTAGGAGGDLKIAGLDRKAAERLRVHVVGKAGASIESD